MQALPGKVSETRPRSTGLPVLPRGPREQVNDADMAPASGAGEPALNMDHGVFMKLERDLRAGVLEKFIAAFNKDCLSASQVMSDAASAQNWSDYHRAAHTLGSNAAMLGALGLAQACRAAESSFKSGDEAELASSAPTLLGLIRPSQDQIERWLAIARPPGA